MSAQAIDKVRKLEGLCLQLPQIDIETDHVIHAGMYSRTIMIPAGALLTGALIKIATTLIISGEVIVYIGDESIDLKGYNVFPAWANRKQAFLAKTDTYVTMVFPTAAKSIEEAEAEFTDDADKLMSRRDTSINKLSITEG